MSDRGPFRLVPYFSSIRFDRAAIARAGAARIAALKVDPATRFVPVWRGRHLMSAGARPVLARLTLAELGLHPSGLDACEDVPLGSDGEGMLFGLDVGGLDTPPTPHGYTYAELRPYDFVLEREDAALAAQVRGLIGRPPAADRPLPRLDPVAVVLPVQGDRVLLARSGAAPNARLLTALSAPVAPGETVEQTAAREVQEKLGVRARRLQYHSSQPWPFPSTIMMGFHLLAENTDLTLGAGISDARWLTREEVFAHEELGFDLPDPRTVAGQMLRRWVLCCDMFGKENPPH